MDMMQDTDLSKTVASKMEYNPYKIIQPKFEELDSSAKATTTILDNQNTEAASGPDQASVELHSSCLNDQETRGSAQEPKNPAVDMSASLQSIISHTQDVYMHDVQVPPFSEVFGAARKSWENEKDELNQKTKALEADCDAFRSKINILLSEKKSWTVHNVQARQKLNFLQLECNSIDEERAAMMRLSIEFCVAKQALGADKDQLEQQLASCRSELNSLRAQRDSYVRESARFNLIKSEWDAEKIELQGRNRATRAEYKLLSDKRHNLSLELDRANAAKEPGKAEYIDMVRAKEHLEYTCTSLSAEKDVLQREINIIQSTSKLQKDELNGKLQELQQSHEHTKTTLEKQTIDLKEVRNLLQEAISKLHKLNVSEEIFSIDDTTVASMWQSLGYAIKNLTSQYFKHFEFKGALEGEYIGSLRLISDQYLNYLGAWREPHVFFRSFIWNSLIQNVLKDPKLIWSRDANHAMRLIRSHASWNIQDAETKYRQWMTQTLQFLHTYCSQTLDPSRFNSGLVADLADLSGKPVSDDVQGKLLDIFDRAVELASMFSRSKAIFSVVMSGRDRHSGDQRNFGFEYDESTMELVGRHGKKDSVTLVCSPSLVKKGNADGEDYHHSVTLAKMEVYM